MPCSVSPAINVLAFPVIAPPFTAYDFFHDAANFIIAAIICDLPVPPSPPRINIFAYTCN